MTPNEREQLEALLPWHAARTLSPAEAKRVEEALASDQELARHFAFVREEMAETVAVNEALGTPSARALDKLLAAIDADQARFPRAALGGILARFLARLSPRTLAWSAAIAGLVIVLEAGAIATFLIGQRGVTYETASVPPPAASSERCSWRHPRDGVGASAGCSGGACERRDRFSCPGALCAGCQRGRCHPVPGSQQGQRGRRSQARRPLPPASGRRRQG